MGALWRRLAARSLLPLEPRLQHGEDRAESRVSPRKSDRQGLFYGEGEGAGSVASISGHPGTEPQWRESYLGVGHGEEQGRVGDSGVLGQAIKRVTGTGWSWERHGRTDPEPRAHLPPVLSSPRAPSAAPGPANSPGPASQVGGGGETFSLETLDTNFVFLARKISLVWKGGVVERAREGAEPAAEQTLRIRFQRLRPTPSPAAVICVRGSVTLGGIKRPAGTSRVQRDSGQRGGLRQRRWFISALPGRALGSQRLPARPGSWAGKRPGVF